MTEDVISTQSQADRAIEEALEDGLVILEDYQRDELIAFLVAKVKRLDARIAELESERGWCE